MTKNSGSRTYEVYGLRIASEIKLRDLAEGSGPADVTIEFGQLPPAVVNPHFDSDEVFLSPRRETRVSGAALFYDWAGIGRVLILEGRRVIIERAEGSIIDDLDPFITGPVLAVLLHQRGSLVLHGSSILATNGSAAGFLGAKGAGKSTLAACMQVRGYKLLSDDILTIDQHGDSVSTKAGYHRIKLFPDSVRAVGASPSDFPYIHRFVDKHSFHYGSNFVNDTVRIMALYVLTESDDISIRELNPSSAFIWIATHTHVAKYIRAMKYEARHFEQCRELIERVPCFEIRRPHQFEKMAAVADMLEEHMAEGNP